MSIIEKITAWSFSRYQEYATCPFKAKCKIILKLKEPGSPAMDRGTDIHKKLETFLEGTGKLPEEAKLLKKEYAALKKTKPEVELELAFTGKWSLTNWFSKDAWCRVKIDALNPPVMGGDAPPIVVVTDHKTGKLKDKEEYVEQLELYSIAGLLSYPVAQIAQSRLLFVDQGKVIEGEPLEAKNLEKAKKRWEIRIAPMLADTEFKPTPNYGCKWCHFRKSNGGPCKHG